MDWMELLSQIFELVLFPVISVLGVALAAFISVKLRELKLSRDSELEKKYIDMIDKTITECVLATTQTYVEALKKEGKFDVDAQKIALEKTYNNVLDILTDDALEYLTLAFGDLEIYLLNKIEAEVKRQK